MDRHRHEFHRRLRHGRVPSHGGDSSEPGWIEKNLKIHFGHDTFKCFDRWFHLPPGQTYEPVVLGAAIMLVIWLILYYMYRNKIFVRI